MVMKSPDIFFKNIKTLTGPLNQQQVDVCNRIMSGCIGMKTSWLSYIFATAWHEAKLIPQPEIGKGKGKPYGKPGHNKKQVPYGRGLAQVTWDTNYEKVDSALDLDGKLIANYDLMLTDEVAVPALIVGMRQGFYTGVNLQKYLPNPLGSRQEFTAARRIINIQDRADLIAGYALSFQNAAIAGGWTNG